MRPHVLQAAIALVAVLAPAAVRAQHEGHQATALPPSAALAQCAQVQPAVDNIIAAATARLESARQSNDPAQMRSAVDYLQGALRDLRTQLAPCAAAGAQADPHAAHDAPPTTKRPAAADPHAGHTMPEPKAAAPKTAKPKPPADPHAAHGAAPTKDPQPKKPTTPKASKPAADPQAGHEPGTPEKPIEKERDPVTGLMVDPATAPRATYQGRTYFFSSEASRKEFLQNPAKFARKKG